MIVEAAKPENVPKRASSLKGKSEYSAVIDTVREYGAARIPLDSLERSCGRCARNVIVQACTRAKCPVETVIGNGSLWIVTKAALAELAARVDRVDGGR